MNRAKRNHVHSRQSHSHRSDPYPDKCLLDNHCQRALGYDDRHERNIIVLQRGLQSLLLNTHQSPPPQIPASFRFFANRTPHHLCDACDAINGLRVHDDMSFVIGGLTHPFWFATPENEYAALFHRYIPSWFTVSDKRVLRGFFEGGESFHTAAHLNTWLIPVLVWTGIIFAIFFTFICVNIIIRKQWTEQDKLSYPIIQVPIELTAPRTIFRPLLWIGFSVSALIEIINGLHHLFPVIPGIPLHYIHTFTERPWTLGWMRFSFNPFVTGLTFFAPLDLAFSVWFFHLFFKAQQVIVHVELGSMPSWVPVRAHGIYGMQQGLGAWTTLGILSLWMTRRHLRQVWRKLIGQPSTLDDSTEPLRYRFAVLGLVLAVIFLVLLLQQAGLSLSVMLFYFAIYLLMSIAITRARAVLGPPYHQIVFTSPQGFMVDVMGTRALGPSSLTILSFLYAFNRENTSHPMPNQLEAFKIAERTGINNTHILLGMVLALLFSILVSFWAYFHVMYEHGVATKAQGPLMYMGFEFFRLLTSWLQYPKESNYTATLFHRIGRGIYGVSDGNAKTIYLVALSPCRLCAGCVMGYVACVDISPDRLGYQRDYPEIRRIKSVSKRRSIFHWVNLG